MTAKEQVMRWWSELPRHIRRVHEVRHAVETVSMNSPEATVAILLAGFEGLAETAVTNSEGTR